MKDNERDRASGMQAEEKYIVALAGKPQGKRPLGKSKYILTDKYNIKMALKEMR